MAGGLVANDWSGMAEERGKEGERIVSEELRRLAPEYGLTILDGVLLTPGRTTSQIDHVVIDRYGVLVVETKTWDALVRGSDAESHWTACYRSGFRGRVQNPLEQNRRHENAVRKELKRIDCPIEPDYVKGVVVFVGTNVSELELGSIEAARVVCLEDLAQYFETRDRFSVNPGDLTEAQVKEYATALRGLNRSGDPEVEAKHWEHRSGGRSRGAVRSSAQASTMREGFGRGGAPSSGPARIDQPHGVADARSVSRPQRTRGRRGESLGQLLLRMALLALFLWWLIFGGGVGFLVRVVVGSLGKTPAPASTAGSPAPATPVTGGASLALAQQRLKEYAPDHYPKVSDLDSPDVAQKGGNTAYTWHFIEQKAAGSATVRTVTIELKPDGSFGGLGFGG